MRLKKTSLKVRKSDIWARPIIPNTTYIPCLPSASMYSAMFNIKNAIELAIP